MFTRRISFCALCIPTLLLFLGIGGISRAKPPPGSECNILLAGSLQQCNISATDQDGKCVLFVPNGGAAGLYRALRCLADLMEGQGCSTAKTTLNGVSVVWGNKNASGKDDCQIVIATSTGKGTATAVALGANSSAYASGGTGGGTKAEAVSVGENGCATAVGGNAAEGSNDDGGRASARSKSIAAADPGKGDGTGSDGVADTKIIGK